ncbi:MAG: molybdopterin molybdenumtransferase MoeA, partial [Gammaproteobacteria bacterium]|nr:molybdopterin molybdenumtransferase MoeA [Gammaproteobacteria bacterium]
LFHKVAIRPGKPLLLARLPGDTLLVGLPGNPMAVAVGLRFFEFPALRAMLGSAPETSLPARSLEAIERRPSITFFAKAIATIDEEARIGVRLLAG